jgi:hypothetical protein
MGNFFTTNHDIQNIETIKNTLKSIDPNFIYRDIEIEISETDNYVIDKKKIFLTIDDKDDIKYFIFKLLHLYTFIVCESIGHSVEWYRKFDEFLTKAIDLNLLLEKNIKKFEGGGVVFVKDT